MYNHLGLFGCCSSPVLAGSHQNVLPCIAVNETADNMRTHYRKLLQCNSIGQESRKRDQTTKNMKLIEKSLEFQQNYYISQNNFLLAMSRAN